MEDDRLHCVHQRLRVVMGRGCLLRLARKYPGSTGNFLGRNSSAVIARRDPGNHAECRARRASGYFIDHGPGALPGQNLIQPGYVYLFGRAPALAHSPEYPDQPSFI